VAQVREVRELMQQRGEHKGVGVRTATAPIGRVSHLHKDGAVLACVANVSIRWLKLAQVLNMPPEAPGRRPSVPESPAQRTPHFGIALQSQRRDMHLRVGL